MTGNAVNETESFSDANVRIDEMFWLPGLTSGQPSAFRDFVEDDLPEASEIIGKMSWMKDFSDDAESLAGEMIYRGMTGFIVRLAAPVPSDFIDGNGYSFSWGHYRIEWFYAQSLADIATLAKEFREQVNADARKKLARTKGERAFERMSDDGGMPSIPTGTEENLNLRTASEIESERLATKRNAEPTSSAE